MLQGRRQDFGSGGGTPDKISRASKKFLFGKNTMEKNLKILKNLKKF